MNRRALGAGVRRAAIAAVLATIAMVVAGCTSGGSPDQDVSPSEVPGKTAQGTAQAFLQAQADGRLGDAVSLSTLSADEFACTWLVADRSVRSVAARVRSVEVDATGDSATVTVQPKAQSNRTTSLELVGGDGAWQVQWPASYGIEAEFSHPAVAELRLADGAIGDEDCSVPAQDGFMSMAAFPGTYIATVVDPTGVVDYGLGANVLVTGEQAEVWDLGEPISQAQLTALQVEFADVREAGLVRCDGGLCGEAVVDDDGQVLPGSLTAVWTDDGKVWSCEVEFGGQVFTGTLERSSTGELSVDLAA